MATNISVLLIFVTLSSIAAQTFQYSRGWTNGKRDGHRRDEDIKEVASNLERILSPCQMNKLKYILEGKTLNEKLFVPCEYLEEEDSQSKRYKGDHGQDPLFEAFQ